MKSLIWILLTFKTFAGPVSVSPVSDLDFGIGVQGDGAKTVLPGTSETTENGSFIVSGDPNKAYSISLPNGPIQLTVTTGGSKIKVLNFTSFPAEGTNGVLNGMGKQTVFIGATREAVPINQKKGKYTGSYMISVKYY